MKVCLKSYEMANKLDPIADFSDLPTQFQEKWQNLTRNCTYDIPIRMFQGSPIFQASPTYFIVALPGYPDYIRYVTDRYL